MKHQIKVMLALLLAGIVLTGAVACDKESEDEDTSTQTTVTTTVHSGSVATNEVTTTTESFTASTEAPVTTAQPTVTTTAAPVTTTKAPVTTTAAPVTTTKAPVTTTAAPVTTTKAPVTTTAAPVTTAPPVTETPVEESKLKFKLNEDGTSYAVTDIGEYTDSHLVIPSIHKGLPVTVIDDWAFSRQPITSVSIPDSITRIGQHAFDQCTQLTELTIPENVTFVGCQAFMECESLTAVTVLCKEVEMQQRVFEACISLNEITIKGNIKGYEEDHGVFYWCGEQIHLTLEGDIVFDYSLLVPMEYVKAVTVKGMSVLSDYQFAGHSMVSVIIPADVIEIGKSAFVENEFTQTPFVSATFEDPDGWYVTETEGSPSGIELDLSDPAANAVYLNETYANYYWYHK